jgi:hypothetical protein
MNLFILPRSVAARKPGLNFNVFHEYCEKARTLTSAPIKTLFLGRGFVAVVQSPDIVPVFFLLPVHLILL